MATYTIEEYNKLIAARANGIREIYYGDKRVSYRSLEEMDRIIADMKADLNIKQPPRRRYISHTKGLR